MTSNPNAEPSRSPLERHTTSSTGFSSLSNRFSNASAETGESSTAASKRNSLVTSFPSDGVGDEAAGNKGSLDAERPVKDGKGSHRSHRSRNSGGFLLSNAVFDQPVESTTETHTRQRHSTHEGKGKAPLKIVEKKHAKRRSNFGAGAGGSPLAANVTSAGTGTLGHNGVGGDSATKANGSDSIAKATAAPLDVDSAQIVNLALNLSESRRNASRRILSQPLPQLSGAIGESVVGGSLRQHLQQQRRVPRNISPKPDRAERGSRISSGQRINSPLQAAFDTHPDGPYQYHFSASTLARAEKAKNTIELMAQYRRLLQFVPPLKPQTLERPDTGSAAGTAPGLPTLSAPSRSVSASSQARQLGRPYNPLQYIRNRKVRARNSRAIDGEAQGFGDVFRVRSWVDDITKEAITADYQTADCLMLPAFSKAAEDAASPHTSPPSAGKIQATTAKVRRPRIDWFTNPADMIADIFWLEQDDNKKLIEDHHGRMIFPQRTELRRPMSRRSDEPEPIMTPSPGVVKKETPEPDLRIDTKLPEFKSVKSDPDKAYDSPASRARQKLRDVRDATRIHHRNNGSISDRRLLRSRSRSDSDSSDSDIGRQRRRRSGTANSADRGKDILEKQMMEMLAQEARQTEWSTPHDSQSQQAVDSIESRRSSQNGVLDRYKTISPSHSRSASLVKQERPLKRDSVKGISSGRASLEVPGGNPRRSLDFDSTAPNSPETKPSKVTNAFVPSIAMDLSPPRSRNTSPSRRPLSKVRSRILPFYERTRDSSRVRGEEDVPEIMPGFKEPTPDSPDTPEGRRRSKSPIKRVESRKTDDSLKLGRKAGSLLRGKGEDSGIRGLFKGSKNPVTRVSDFLWKKESTGLSSGFSTDESDVEDLRLSQTKSEKKGSRESSAGTIDEFDAIAARKEKPSFILDMPVFTSPFDRRGRSTRPKEEPGSPEPSLSQEKQAREERRKFSRAHLLELPPRIDVHSASPTSSPDLGAADRFNRDSSVSDIESNRGSYSNGVQSADARLNAILGMPGRRRNALPITGLSSLETSHDTRPSLEGKRQWSISDRGTSVNRGPMTKMEIARVRALLLSSGIKAKEISRRAAAPRDLRTDVDSRYKDVALLAKEELKLVPKSQEHRLAARIISDDIQLSSQMWHVSADTFCNTTVSELLDKIETLRSRVGDTLTPLTRKAADEADEVSKELVTNQTLQVKSISDTIAKMMRRRSRKFRWLRRGGWVMVEWALVGVMWWLWFMVVLVRVVMGVGKGAVAAVRWLFWL
ncbi:hypothetical protein N431DRAFT_429509 [Stipitochalara longipes BDJ]|nr:hypothetical protein N431DRAFT_429509 [Stipitochalara longipes BDJ]